MSRGQTPGLYVGVQSSLTQNPEKRALIHNLPDPAAGTWKLPDLDGDVSRADLKWLHNVGIIERVTTHNGNSGNEWRSTKYVTDLQQHFSPPGCGEGGVLDCGGDRFVSASDGLECKHCGQVTSRADARARKNGGGAE